MGQDQVGWFKGVSLWLRSLEGWPLPIGTCPPHFVSLCLLIRWFNYSTDILSVRLFTFCRLSFLSWALDMMLTWLLKVIALGQQWYIYDTPSIHPSQPHRSQQVLSTHRDTPQSTCASGGFHLFASPGNMQVSEGWNHNYSLLTIKCPV